ncbi:hypothetical protein ACEP28_32370 [Pseudomonas aeruginosa]
MSEPSGEKPTVTVEQALQILNTTCECMPRRAPQMRLAVKIYSPGAIGGTPHAEVTHITGGIDFDSNLMLITPNMPLTALSPDDVVAIRESVRKGQSWHSYQAYKAMDGKLKELQQKVKLLTEERTHLLEAVRRTWELSPGRDSQILRLGSIVAGGIRRQANDLFEVSCTLPGSTLSCTDLESAEAARKSLESTATQWLQNLLA